MAMIAVLLKIFFDIIFCLTFLRMIICIPYIIKSAIAVRTKIKIPKRITDSKKTYMNYTSQLVLVVANYTKIIICTIKISRVYICTHQCVHFVGRTAFDRFFQFSGGIYSSRR